MKTWKHYIIDMDNRSAQTVYERLVKLLSADHNNALLDFTSIAIPGNEANGTCREHSCFDIKHKHSTDKACIQLFLLDFSRIDEIINDAASYAQKTENSEAVFHFCFSSSVLKTGYDSFTRVDGEGNTGFAFQMTQLYIRLKKAIRCNCIIIENENNTAKPYKEIINLQNRGMELHGQTFYEFYNKDTYVEPRSFEPFLHSRFVYLDTDTANYRILLKN